MSLAALGSAPAGIQERDHRWAAPTTRSVVQRLANIDEVTFALLRLQ
jgi:hypothetical protein